MSRLIILGRDFTIPNAILVGWTRHGTKRICMDNKLVLETEENFEGKTLALSRYICIPPRCTVVAEVSCLTDMNVRFQNLAPFSSETIQTCIVSLLFMTCHLTKSESNNKICQICPLQRNMQKSTIFNLWTLLLHPNIRRRLRSLSKHAQGSPSSSQT